VRLQESRLHGRDLLDAVGGAGDAGDLGDVVGAENPVTSRDLHVLVEEAAEPVSSTDVDGCAGGSQSVVYGWALMQ
jgi:hypothetical protein